MRWPPGQCRRPGHGRRLLRRAPQRRPHSRAEPMQAASTALCRCICGTGKKDQLDATGRSLGGIDLDTLEEIDEPPFHPPPLVTGRLVYSVLADQPLRGAPIREGELWYLSAEEKVEPVRVSLHVNGFSFVHGEREVSISLSPFALVRNCKFQSSYSNVNLADIKIFKVSLFTQNLCYYYGVRGEDERWAEEERSRWVLDISRVMRLVTQSLFPPFSIMCEPIVSVVSTHRRLMAGYLVHHDDAASASVLYCELHPHCEDQAKLVLYENELCQVPVTDIYFSDCSMCSEKVGINCSCFCIEDHQFSTRTLPERKLWLRAISNVKVKLQNHAPTPTWEELRHYRLAIKEYIGTIRASLEGHAPMDALLQRSLRSQRKPHRLAHPSAPAAVEHSCAAERGGAGVDARGLGALPPPPSAAVTAASEPDGAGGVDAVSTERLLPPPLPLAEAAAEAAGQTGKKAKATTLPPAPREKSRPQEDDKGGGNGCKGSPCDSSPATGNCSAPSRAELAGELQAIERALATPQKAPSTQHSPESRSGPRSKGNSGGKRRERSPPSVHFGRVIPTPQELRQPGEG